MTELLLPFVTPAVPQNEQGWRAEDEKSPPERAFLL